MKHPSKFAALVLVVASSACQGPAVFDAAPASRPSAWSSHDSRVPVPMKASGPIEGRRTYGAPVRLPGHSVWLSSFVITRLRSIFRDSDPFAEGGLAGRGASYEEASQAARLVENDVRWHNALFSDRETGEQWQLVDRRAFVSRWWLVVTPSDDGPVSRAMVFAVTVDDTEGDGDLDDQDACVAMLTTGDGREPVVVTPPGAQLGAVRLRDDGRLLTFELRFDVDEDGEFEGDEPVREWVLDLAGGERTARPWNAPTAEAQLEGLYD